LSARELQRLALARAVDANTSVLLLYEPSGNLHPYNAALIEEIVRSENRSRRGTIVLVAYDPFQARRIADRTSLMVNGRSVEIAATKRFFSDPQQPETAAFLRGDLVY